MKKLLATLLLFSCGKNSAVTSFQPIFNSSPFVMEKTYPVNDGDSYFLIMGGGYDPYGSNLALELNMHILDDTLSFYNHQNSNIYRLFGGGNDRSVSDVIAQFREVDFAEVIVMGITSDGMSNQAKKMRHNNLQNLLGGNNKYDFNEQITSINSRLRGRDKFRFYYTGHGNHNEDYKNNYLAVFGDGEERQLTVKEVVKALDKIDPNTEVQFITVSCFGGGFADMTYVDGDLTKGFSNYNRCGFFPVDRKTPAAGCSDDINLREEYTPYFIEAYLGLNKHGEKINVDYNQDGMISSSEAHAYVIISENSYYDVPIATSDSLLNDFYQHEYGNAAENEFLNDLKTHTWTDLYAQMNTEERVIADSLKEQLSVFWPNGVDNIYHLEESIQNNIKRFDYQKPKPHDLFFFDIVASQDVKEMYPYLGNNYDLEYIVNGETISKEAMIDDFYKFIKSQSGYEAAAKSFQDSMINRTNNDNKFKRLNHLIRAKIIELKLMNSNKTNWMSKYFDLKKCEAASFF